MWPWCLAPFLLFCCFFVCFEAYTVTEEKNNGDGTGLHVGVCDGCPAQGDGRCHAGTGGCSATEVDGPRQRNVEQSDQPASSDAWTDHQREPPETPWTGGQDTSEGSFSSLNGSACVPKNAYLGNTWFSAQLTHAYTDNIILKPFSQQCCSSSLLFSDIALTWSQTSHFRIPPIIWICTTL